mmetsp:Transcript_34732/g.98416  ORF Transcript_34732/g.98416 Transcript_34732/m.98416 type:complete len:168 (+) Transcript_34732:1127-1630(+)
MQALGICIEARAVEAFTDLNEFWGGLESLLMYKKQNGDYRTGYLYPASFPPHAYKDHDQRYSRPAGIGAAQNPGAAGKSYFNHALTDPAGSSFRFSEVFPKLTAKLTKSCRIAYWLDVKGGTLRLVKGKARKGHAAGTETCVWKGHCRYKTLHVAFSDCEQALRPQQ